MPPDATRSQRIAKLRKRLLNLRERYGSEVSMDGVVRLAEKADRRRARVEFLTERIAEMQAEIALLEDERSGYLTGIEALMADLVRTIERRHPEGWSPVPIPGYRMWHVVDNEVTGVVMPWKERSMEAACLHKVPGDDIPHSNGRCGPPACGIYATKSPGFIFGQMTRRPDWAIGVVGLSGKVVEHRLGYRAQRATIEALCLVAGGHSLHATDPVVIEAALQDPEGIVGTGVAAQTDEAELQRAIPFLKTHERSMRWTLENRSE